MHSSCLSHTHKWEYSLSHSQMEYSWSHSQMVKTSQITCKVLTDHIMPNTKSFKDTQGTVVTLQWPKTMLVNYLSKVPRG